MIATTIRVLRFISDTVPIVGVYTALLFMLVSTVISVFARYVFNFSIGQTLEINTLLVPVLLFLALAQSQRQRGHIKVTVVTMWFAHKTQLILENFVFLCGFAFLLLLGMQTLKDAVYAQSINQFMMGSRPPVPTSWSKFVVPIGCWLFSLQYLRDIVNNIIALKKASPYRSEVPE